MLDTLGIGKDTVVRGGSASAVATARIGYVGAVLTSSVGNALINVNLPPQTATL